MKPPLTNPDSTARDRQIAARRPSRALPVLTRRPLSLRLMALGAESVAVNLANSK